MLKNDSFKKYIENTDNYSIYTLQRHFKVKDTITCILFIVNFLNSEIRNLRILDKETKKYIFKSFKFLNNPKNYKEINNFEELEENLDLLLENIYVVSIDGDNDINSFLNIVSYNIELLKKQLHFSSKTTNEKEKNLYEFAKILIFEIRDINLCIELFKTFPDIINEKNENGNYLIDKILDKYINVLINNNSDYILNYYDTVINLLLSICKEKMDFYHKEQIIDRLDKIKNECHDLRIRTFLKRTIVNIDNTYIFETIEDISNIYNINFNEPKVEFNPIINYDYKDTTDKFIITVDGEYTKIRDDAFSVTKLKNGNYLLEIYASNVSSYILLGSLLDKRARGIGKTLWTDIGTINMFPTELSQNLLSLNLNEEKRCICYSFEFTKNLELVNFDLKRVKIKPSYNLSFNEVNKNINNIEDYRLKQTLDLAMMFLELNEYNNKNMNEYHALKTIRRQILNINNKNRDLENANNNSGEKLINIFKLLVGNHVSSLIYNSGLPFIYRINTAKLGNDIKNLKEKYSDESEILHIINSSLGKSYYSTENLGHKGLGLDCYSNVSISIRNYISLVDERLICKYLIDKNIGNDKELLSLQKYLDRLCEEINLRMKLNDEYVLELGKLKQKKIKKEPFGS